MFTNNNVMKNLILPLIVFCFITTSQIEAQDLASAENTSTLNYKKRHAIYDYKEVRLNNTDTVPEFETKANKLKITGTIYQNDGKTPARDVILFIHQPDETGNYTLKKDALKKRYVYHRAWIKTDADGAYTFYTFIPGSIEHSNDFKQIHRSIKVPGKPEFNLDSYFFNDDPLIPNLSLSCRANFVKSMLKPEKVGDMYVAKMDIKLPKAAVEVNYK